eukprot:TRINITY_DN22155_c0_g1_i7.p1 TRINITY_DN22155_c0_g1~~TRINITY_DN22155_c0_g1_i7.p1  ORF type:complete len:721 (+),score=183.61 TRINITY_DN22155_c0_g1_i7:58-2220(+)
MDTPPDHPREVIGRRSGLAGGGDEGTPTPEASVLSESVAGGGDASDSSPRIQGTQPQLASPVLPALISARAEKPFTAEVGVYRRGDFLSTDLSPGGCAKRSDFPSDVAVDAPLLGLADAEGDWEYGSDAGDQPCSRKSAFANLTNCILDAGILGVPYVMGQAGFIGGFVIIIAAAAVSCFTIELLIHTGHRACAAGEVACVAFEELGELAGGVVGRNMILGVQFVYCVGALVGYVVVVRDNLSTAVAGLLGSSAGGWVGDVGKVGFAAVACCVVLLPLCLQRDVSSIGHISALTPTVVAAIIVIFLIQQTTNGTDLCHNQDPPCQKDYASVFTADTPAMTGLCIFAFLCHHNSFQVYRTLGSAATPESFAPVVRGSVMFAAVASLAMGVVVYATFGTSTKDDIFLNYPTTNASINTARMLMAVNMLLSFPMNFMAAREVLQVILEDKPAARKSVASEFPPFERLPADLTTVDGAISPRSALSQHALPGPCSPVGERRLMHGKRGQDAAAATADPPSLREEPALREEPEQAGTGRALSSFKGGRPRSIGTPTADTLMPSKQLTADIMTTFRSDGRASVRRSIRSRAPTAGSGFRRSIATFSATGLATSRVWSAIDRPARSAATSVAGGGIRNDTTDTLHYASTLVLFVCTIAGGLFSPSLGSTLTLVGGVAGSFLAFVFPGLLALKIDVVPLGGRTVCWAVVVFGIGAAILTVVTVSLGQG